jgi:hypothetical protein
MVRIRRLLSESIIESRPYRLLIPVCADFVEVFELLHRGELSKALDLYRGPLLPHSQAPAIEEERRRVEQQIRAALIGKADPELLERWLNTPWGRDDRQLWQLLACTARTATTSGIAAAEARRLADENDDPRMSPGWDERRCRNGAR